MGEVGHRSIKVWRKFQLGRIGSIAADATPFQEAWNNLTPEATRSSTVE